MNKIFIADSTIATSSINNAFSMSFKEKMEVAKRLEKIKVNVIEMPKAVEKTDALLVKSLATMIKESTLSVAAAPDKAEIDAAADAIKNSKNARIRILVPTSPVQMEYILKAKPKAVLEKVPEMVAYAKTFVKEIEVSFIDTSRSEKEFVAKLSQGVVASGATILDFCDTAGTWLPEETTEFIKYIKENVRGIENVTISVNCSDEIRLGNANSVAAIKAGATQVKTTLVGKAAPKIGHFVNLISEKGEAIQVAIDIPRAEFNKLWDIAEAMARRDHVQVAPSTSVALNKLGLSTQVPMNAVFLTTGSARRVKVGNGKGILFQHSSDNKQFAYKSQLMQLIVFAMREIGEGKLTDEELGIIKSHLANVSEKEYAHDIRLAPVWIQETLHRL